MLHDIQLDTLTDLLNKLPLEPKGKMNVMYCLQSFLDYAKRSRRIFAMPSFPKKSAYQLEKKKIEWLPEARQLNVLEKIPKEHQPIFYFLKHTMRRPAEAMALKRIDYDMEQGAFTICRSISDRKVINKTKTGEIHTIPCVDELKPFIDKEMEKAVISEFFFTCATSRNKGKRYSHSILSRIWKKACGEAGEEIDLYSGLKHSSCCQYINEKGLSESQLQAITEHARIESVRYYAKTEVKRKKELMETPSITKVDFQKKQVEK